VSFLELFKQPCLIGAHRGFHSKHPENTMSSLKDSIGSCDFIEVDVQLSLDEFAVIMHDDTLERTTNVREIYRTRLPYKLTDFTYAELSSLDYGSWFYVDEKKPEPLLSLKKVLEFVKAHQMYLNIELKDLNNTFSDMQVVSSVLKEIEASDTKELILLSSFRHQYLPLCKKIQPNIPTAALVENEHPKSLIKYLKALNVDAYHFDDALVDKTTVKKLRDAGFFVNIYTVNDKKRRQQLFDMGVNGVFSDYLE
jgi:glycerophosphoryl diester phosphodiesterase